MNYISKFSLIVSTYNQNLPVVKIFEKYAQINLNLDKKIKKYLICENPPSSSIYFDSIIENKPGKTWSKQLTDSIIHIKSEYIIYCLEDYIFYQSINLKKFYEYLNWSYTNQVNYLRLLPKPKGFKKKYNHIYELEKYSLYKNSLFFTIWKKDFFLELLKNFETPWEFEVYGTKLVKNYKKYYTVNEKFIYIKHLVAKGCWIRSNLYGLEIDKDIIIQKPYLSKTAEAKWHIFKFFLKLFEKIPDNIIKYHFYYLFK